MTFFGNIVSWGVKGLAEYERKLIISRIKNGLAEAKKKGVRLGAEPKHPLYRKKVSQMRGHGKTWKEICEQLGINYRTAKKCLA